MRPFLALPEVAPQSATQRQAEIESHAGVTGEGFHQCLCGDFLGEVLSCMRESCFSHLFAAGGIGEQSGEKSGKRFGLAFFTKQTSLSIDDHLRNASDMGGDAGKFGGHGLHQHGREIVLAAVFFGFAGKGEDLGFLGEQTNDFVHRQGAGEGDEMVQVEVGNLESQFGFEWSFADDAAMEIQAAIAHQGTGGDEVIVAFLLDQSSDAENAASLLWILGSLLFFFGALEWAEIESVVNAPDPCGGGGKPVVKIARSVVADGDDQAGIARERFGFWMHVTGVAEDVVGMGGEAVAEAVKFAQPPAGAGSHASEVGVGVVDTGTQLAHAMADPGGFINAQFVGAVVPVSEGEHDALRKPVLFFELEDFFDQLIFRRQKVNLVEEFLWEMLDRFGAGIVNGKDDGTQAETHQFKHLANAKRLGERWEAFEDVGEVVFRHG